ncbi:sensor histidine kinase/response regulator, putative [Talaromyces stipitatus ATCC 10500]|uniref:Sensor histidine kinase/response regulator, putative n=1 Tax=Talaromyces stipitatus (strain ATCC 10500 / CBS 375.48 / QM 6759 / NRRL 1006) TaxID=441959 RepID=B8LYL7_TALSN|nr:sensor histidine kinase/response regulator, putative [Talaromyces stipitatus ATCC 10500]EED23375.1 sensor histidine kinase/response regulator, putative [Talaromyces stipitatus ATCC 10500]
MASTSPQGSPTGEETTTGRPEHTSTASHDTASQDSAQSDAGQSLPASSKARFPRLSFDTPDRVFPIRSVISVDPTASNPPTSQSPPPQWPPFRPLSPIREGNRAYSGVNQRDTQDAASRAEDSTDQKGSSDVADENKETAKAARHSVIENISAQFSSDGQSSTSSTDGGVPVGRDDPPRSRPLENGEPELVTSRFQHIVTENGHAIITGREGEDFQFCEDEPIHIPGAIQSFGVLLALEEEKEGKLVVRVVSENSADLLGYTPKQLFALESFTDILTEEQEDNLLDHVDFIRDESCDPRIHGPEVFIVSIANPAGETKKFWCAMHVNDANDKLIICEFEFEDDQAHPLNVSGQTTPDEPSDTLGIDPTPEELAASTVNISRPLRVLRNARRRKGEAAAMKVFNILTQIQEQLAAAPTLDVLLNTATGLAKELTGFHRVMIYQFDSSWNGMVVAELVDPRATKDLYKGLHFPASDIPKQARELYKINKVRLLYDRDLTTSRLVCRTVKDLEMPLDMTHAYLRAMSPVHLRYLAHMDVRASMSISINAFNELWGLISCHSYGATGMRVSFPIRKMCRLIGDTVSRNIERLSYTSRLQARKLINTVPTEANPSGYIIASSDDLLKLFDADYGALSIRDETKLLGRITHTPEVLALLEYLKMRQLNSVLASHDVGKDFPDLRYPPGFKHVSGLLYVPLSAGGKDFIVFFRRGQMTEIKWAGNPYEKKLRDGTTGYLEPRKSFQTWRETVLSRSREWSETDIETAAVLCLVYGKFIEVWRQKEAAMQSTQLTKLLLANSAHEVRTPLNAIVNYLEIALEGSLDSETRENLARSHSASKSLIYVINDLLDLTNTEKGQNLIKDEVFDLYATFKEATEMFQGEAKRKNIVYNFTLYSGLPKSVLGDQRRVRQVIVNIIANAIQHTESGHVNVEIWRSPVQPESHGTVDVEFAVNDTGSGMSPATVDALFRDLEQVSSEEENYYYEQDEDKEQAKETQDGGEKRVLGLGLALVARIVRNMHGQLSVKSEEGKGSRFKILLRFPVPTEQPVATTVPQITGPEPVASPSTPPLTEGEVLLVDSNARPKSQRRLSAESSRSGGSFGSSRSGRSEADRLISAIQEPALVNRSATPDESRKSNVSSKSLGSATQQSISSTSSAKSGTPGPIALPGPPDFRHMMPLGSPPAPGQEPITDSGMPMSALRVGETEVKRPPSPLELARRRSASIATTVLTSPGVASEENPFDALHVLVAEDDPVNSKIVQKRLQRAGHSVHLTGNGEECAIAYRANPQAFDAILMDIQMPIMDGMDSTEMIRKFEQSSHDVQVSDKAKPLGRVPIFAVSASLVEKDVQKYIDTGFDGYIMKPIDFKRVNAILSGLQAYSERKALTYLPGNWEHGGWFDRSKIAEVKTEAS